MSQLLVPLQVLVGGERPVIARVASADCRGVVTFMHTRDVRCRPVRVDPSGTDLSLTAAGVLEAIRVGPCDELPLSAVTLDTE